MLNNICKVLENVNLRTYNTYKIETVAKYVAFPKTAEELIDLLKYIRNNNYNYFILGNGSNVILPDDVFDGVIISFKEYNKININNNKVYAQAGAMLPKIAYSSIDNSLKGLEWACGIPGTLGGAIFGNAGAYLHEIMEFVEYVDALDKDYNVIKLYKKDITYSYRTTSFKEKNEYIILGAELSLEKGDKEESLALVEDRLERRKSSQPLEYPSAGSVFRNPENLSTGKLIEDLGLKGTKIGGASISLKHGNFIINEGSAKARDIINLIELMKKKVKEEYDIDLICEQEIVKWD